MFQPAKVLVIEDEKDIAHVIRDYLTVNKFDVMIAATGKEARDIAETTDLNFIILDLTLPDYDGIELCRQIREKSHIPILILSARGSDTDKVLGLGFGADDYMTKPFSLSELVARINAHLRMHERLLNTQKDNEILCFGKLKINKKAYKVTLDNKVISLSAKEFDLLYFLSKHSNQVFSKRQLLDEIWGYAEYGDENTITVYIRRLREKIEAIPSNPVYIQTVWGIGYKFSTNNE
ncbi:response regulator transcription factor [Cytobacillus praedii]|uniref:response regulator transcription factor n=1 Tax=Cytobacillus praedii TaxID=1742358 RepID=UPI00070E1CD0|nr:response regulator transcription factor [Cytobacillus praedii]